MPLLNIFGDLERFTTEELYPYRYVITPVLLAMLGGAAFAAYRLGLHLWVRRNLVLSSAIAVPLVAVSLVAGNYFLSPLWERKFLEEASPLAAAPMTDSSPPMATGSSDPAGSTGSSDTSGSTGSSDMAGSTESSAGQTSMNDATATPTFQPATAYAGEFVGADDFHFGRGDALIIETEPGKYVLRVENFSVRNGPDLFVYLSEDATGATVSEALNLGELKATDGAFNYEIPASIDISTIKSAVVWCKQFAVLFTHAELGAP